MLWQVSGADPYAMFELSDGKALAESSLCGPVKGVPRVDEGEQELSRLGPSVWELSRGVCTFRPELLVQDQVETMLELWDCKASVEPQSFWATESSAKGR